MIRSEDRILVTHAGSLPRPEALTALYARRARGEAVNEEEIDQLATAALRDVVPRQQAAGIDVANNGEMPREGFFLYVRRRMSGFGGGWDRPLGRDVTQYPSFLALRRASYDGRLGVSNFQPPEAVSDVRYLDPSGAGAEAEQFRSVLDESGVAFSEAFLTAPSPGMIVRAMRNRHYDSEKAYIDAVADALRLEYEAIHRAGFLLQLDCPDLAMERHMSYADRPLDEFLAFVETVIAAINRSIANIPRDRVRMHVCWGNYEGPHDRDVPLDDIRSEIGKANVGAFFLPMGNPRHAHEYHSFERMPLADDQLLVAGVIDTTSNVVEHPQVIAERLVRIARAVGDPRRVLAGTDCGFDTSAGMGAVAAEVAWAKLRALAEGARIASRVLF
jgi:5-methyltetrahydropteroyltriglutamate--homocysteine methyltransferase